MKNIILSYNMPDMDGVACMYAYSELLNKSIESIINIKEENDIDSLFRKGGTTMLQNDIKGLDDFELIAFVVIV